MKKDLTSHVTSHVIRNRSVRYIDTRIPHHQTPKRLSPLSCYIEKEESMDNESRKKFKLPCGYTPANSWAALKKAWRGFKIARANNDSGTMAKYARVITKLEIQMGIERKKFDDGLVDEETTARLILENVNLKDKRIWRNCRQKIDERTPEYNEPLASIPVDKPSIYPRGQIFDSTEVHVQSSKTRKDNCQYQVPVPRANVQSSKTRKDNCQYQVPVQRADVQSSITRKNNCKYKVDVQRADVQTRKTKKEK